MKTIKLILAIFLLLLSSCHNQDRESAEIKIGAVFPLSGFGAIGGTGELNASNLAVKEINRSGGIQGKQINFLVEDNKSDMNQTATAVKKLINLDKISFLVGPSWAEFAAVGAPIANSNKTIMITPSGYTRELVVNKPYVFTLLPAHKYSVLPLGSYVKDQHHKKIALISTHNSFCDTLNLEIKDYFANNQVPLELDEQFNPEHRDFRSLISKLKKLKFDAVVLNLLEGGGTYTFLKQSTELDFTPQFYSGPSLPYEGDLLENLAIAENIVFFEFVITVNDRFTEKYIKAYNEPPKLSSGQAYDAIYLIKHVIETCNKDLLACVQNVTFNGVTGPIRFDKDGNFAGNTKISKLFAVKHAKIVELSTESTN